jgi:hypothetical protein
VGSVGISNLWKNTLEGENVSHKNEEIKKKPDSITILIPYSAWERIKKMLRDTSSKSNPYYNMGFTLAELERYKIF